MYFINSTLWTCSVSMYLLVIKPVCVCVCTKSLQCGDKVLAKFAGRVHNVNSKAHILYLIFVCHRFVIPNNIQGSKMIMYVWVCFCHMSRRFGKTSSKSKKNNYVHITAVVILGLKDSLGCPSCNLVEDAMGRAVVQVTLFGLLLALTTTLPVKVSPLDRTPLGREIKYVWHSLYPRLVLGSEKVSLSPGTQWTLVNMNGSSGSLHFLFNVIYICLFFVLRLFLLWREHHKAESLHFQVTSWKLGYSKSIMQCPFKSQKYTNQYAFLH